MKPERTSFDLTHLTPGLRRRTQREVGWKVVQELKTFKDCLPHYTPGKTREEMKGYCKATASLGKAIRMDLDVLPLEGIGSSLRYQIEDIFRAIEHEHRRNTIEDMALSK